MKIIILFLTMLFCVSINAQINNDPVIGYLSLSKNQLNPVTYSIVTASSTKSMAHAYSLLNANAGRDKLKAVLRLALPEDSDSVTYLEVKTGSKILTKFIILYPKNSTFEYKGPILLLYAYNNIYPSVIADQISEKNFSDKVRRGFKSRDDNFYYAIDIYLTFIPY